MKVIWKRPDGFHGASPDDYEVIEVASNLKIWLHRRDHKNYPFRVSGGWQDEAATHRLNQLISLIPASDADWVAHLVATYEHSQASERSRFVSELLQWLSELRGNLKGDTWELEIMAETLQEVTRHIEVIAQTFISDGR